VSGETGKLAPIFISYSTQDAAVANAVAASLEELNLKPWIASREVRPGESFTRAINTALGNAGYVVLLISHASMASRWVEREWMAALSKEGTVLLPLRLDGTPLPPLLNDIISIDYTSPDGAAALKDFFQRELSPPTERTRAGGPGLAGATRRELRLVMQRCLDRLAFRELLYDLEIEEDSLPGESLHEKVLFLLHTAERRVVLPQMIDHVERDHAACIRHQMDKLRA
jgi:TIR domain-containing protein